MATANKALKKRAQAFADKHELSYLQAFKAVDEPLHQLRDLMDIKEISRADYFPGLRLATEADRRVSPYADSVATDQESWSYASLVARMKLSRFNFSEHFYMELGRRLNLLEKTHTYDIWRYRELHRAGLLFEDAPAMEPFFHHFSTEFTWGAESAFFQAAQTGIFGVSIASAADYNGSKPLIPITEDELESLKRGDAIEKIELAPLPDAGAFYRLQEAQEAQTEKEDKQTADREAVNYFVDLIDNYLEGMDRSERSSLRPVIRDLVSQDSVTMENIVTELRNAQNPTARKLGARIVRATGVSVIYSTTGKTAEKGSAVDILNALGLDDDELRSAREEVALEKARESMVQSMNSLCSTLISNFNMRFEENRKLIRDFALGELDENGGVNFLAGIIRALRNSDSLDARHIGAKLIDGLATLDDADEETSDEVHAIISSMQTKATRIGEMSGTISVVYPY